MAINPKSFIPDILWLSGSVVLTGLIMLYLEGGSVSKNEIDVHFHDTYFVLPALTTILVIFCLVTFLFFYLKESRKHFTRRFSNIIALVTGLASIVSLSLFIKNLIITGYKLAGGVAVYPPLSALGNTDFRIILDPTIDVICNILFLLELIVLIALLNLVFRWGFQRSRSTSE